MQKCPGPREGLESGPECPPHSLLLSPLSPVDLACSSLHSAWLCAGPVRPQANSSSFILSAPIPNSQGRGLIGPQPGSGDPSIQSAVAWGESSIPWVIAAAPTVTMRMRKGLACKGKECACTSPGSAFGCQDAPLCQCQQLCKKRSERPEYAILPLLSSRTKSARLPHHSHSARQHRSALLPTPESVRSFTQLVFCERHPHTGHCVRVNPTGDLLQGALVDRQNQGASTLLGPLPMASCAREEKPLFWIHPFLLAC